MSISSQTCTLVISAISAVGAVASAVAALLSYLTSNKAHKELCEIRKRYSGGGVQIAGKALDRNRLETVAIIASKVFENADGCADKVKEAYRRLYSDDHEKYSALSGALDDLERTCALIVDDAFPPNVKESEIDKIKNYLKRAQIFVLVEAYKSLYPILWSFATQMLAERKIEVSK